MDCMDNYTKIKVVGKGSFGQAVLVKSKLDAREYIMKQVTISSMSLKEKEEALNEVNVLNSLKHPNIVQYVTSFQDANKLCIVMEYAEGGDLYQKIQSARNVPFKEEQILDWFIQICLAVKHCHDKRILHRDLKTQNIFLTQKNTIKLGDFGIARVLRNTMELARTMVGTPYYLSPELCQEKPYNNKSDVWALGCVLYELVTLKHAFEGHDMKALVGKILRGIYPPVNPRYSKNLREIIDKMLQRDPKNRPSITSILNSSYIRKRMDQWLGNPFADMKLGLSPDSQSSSDDNNQPVVDRKQEEYGRSVVPINEQNRKLEQIRFDRGRQHMEAMRKLKAMKDKPLINPYLVNQKADQENQKLKDLYLARRMKEDEERKRIEALHKLDEERRYRIHEAEKRKIEEERKRIEMIKVRREEEEKKRKEKQEVYRLRQKEDMLRRKALEEEAASRRKAKEEELALRKQRDDLERRKAFEEAKLQAYRNRMRVKQEEEQVIRYIEERDLYEPASFLERKEEDSRISERKRKKDLDKVEDPLADFRKQQYWEMRKARERNRARVEAQLYGYPSEESDKDEVVGSEPGDLKDHAMTVDGQVSFDLNDTGSPSEEEYKSMVRTMIGKLNEQKDQIQDADDIFTSEVDIESPIQLGAQGKFQLHGKALQLNNVSETDSLYYRIESLREYIGQEMGEGIFINVYRLIEGQKQNDDDDVLQEKIVEVLGSKEKLDFVPLIHQLIFCEEVHFANSS